MGKFNLMMASKPMPSVFETLRKENEDLIELKEINNKFRLGQLSTDFNTINGMLTFKGRYYVAKKSKLNHDLIKEFYSTPTAGHGGVKRTLVRISNLFF